MKISRSWPVAITEEAHLVVYASIPTAPSQWENRAQEDQKVDAPADVCPTVEALQYTGFLSPEDYLVDLHHISNQQFVSADQQCRWTSSVYFLAWCKYIQSPEKVVKMGMLEEFIFFVNYNDSR